MRRAVPDDDRARRAYGVKLGSAHLSVPIVVIPPGHKGCIARRSHHGIRQALQVAFRIKRRFRGSARQDPILDSDDLDRKGQCRKHGVNMLVDKARDHNIVFELAVDTIGLRSSCLDQVVQLADGKDAGSDNGNRFSFGTVPCHG